MSFKIELEHNIEQAFTTFSDLQGKEIAKAARRALGRTLTTLRKESVIDIKKELRIQSSVLKNKYIWIDKARGKGLSDLSGAVVFQSRGLQLIDFIRGSKAPTPQKGVKVRNRKKVRAEVTPGKRFVVGGGFVAMTASKGLQIMKRDKRTAGHLLMQTAPSLGSLLLNEKKKIGAKLQSRGADIFQKNFVADLNYRVSAMTKKVKDSPVFK